MRVYRAAKTRFAPQGGVVGFLGIAFARLEFVQDSIEVLAGFASPVAVLRVLVQLDMGNIIGKDLEGLRGWREVPKIATGIAGSEDMGRIHYTPDGARVLVSVHVKQDDKEQPSLSTQVDREGRRLPPISTVSQRERARKCCLPVPSGPQVSRSRSTLPNGAGLPSSAPQATLTVLTAPVDIGLLRDCAGPDTLALNAGKTQTRQGSNCDPHALEELS